jgi:hypothetical protein
MRSDGGRRGRGRTSAWTLFWRTQAGEAKGKGPDSPDSRLLRLVRQKKKTSLKISRSPITLQKTRFLLVAKARISPVACLFVCLYLLIILLLLTKAGRQAGRQATGNLSSGNERPTVPILSLLPKRKETKGEKTKKKGERILQECGTFSHASGRGIRNLNNK